MKSAGVHAKGTVTLSDIIQGVKKKQGFNKAGAVNLFIGVVRGEDVEGNKVQKLDLEAYEEKADEVLSEICRDLRQKHGIVEVQIHHLLGEFDVGEDLVYVLVAGAHREDVFPVLEKAVERYKKEVPIFKKESAITSKGKKTTWISDHSG